jgi:uncharacterized membrane protein
MGATEPHGAPQPPPQPPKRPELRSAPRVVAGYDRLHPTVDMQRDVDRLTFFSDAVFAIAATLLALNLVLPAHTHDIGAALSTLWPRYLSLAITFLVIGVYWMAHHALFAVVVRYDRRLLWINLFLLMSVVVLPFTTSVLAEHGSHPLSVVVYACSVAATGLLATLLTWYALAHGRCAARGLDPAFARFMTWRGLIVPGVFLASLPLAWVSTGAVELSWLAIWPLQLIVRHRFGSSVPARRPVS